MKRHGRPGMPPSPNQSIVLEDLKSACDDGDWLTIDGVHFRLVMQKKGGGPDYKRPGEWMPWHRSTVRDHLNDLVLKDLVVKKIVRGRAYYQPKT